MVYWGLYWGPPIWANDHIDPHMLESFLILTATTRRYGEKTYLNLVLQGGLVSYTWRFSNIRRPCERGLQRKEDYGIGL